MNPKQETAAILSKLLKVSIHEQMLEYPKQTEHGDLSLPCFRFAKRLHQPPQRIAEQIKDALEPLPLYEKVEVIGGYANLFLNRNKVATSVLNNEQQEPEDKGQITIDMSSPNIAKPFSMGHLRSTVIGESLSRIYKKNGFTPVKINHLGDWGTQFGKLISAYKQWGNEEAVKAAPIKELLKLYVRFHEEGDILEGRRWFKALEDGDEEAVELWKWFKDESLKEFSKIYQLLGVSFDSNNGEAFYNDKMQDVVTMLQEKNLLTTSDGAEVVLLDDEELPPCLIRKSDGATLYATRDLAAAIYRHNTYHFTESIYVVGNEQQLHFAQLKAVLKKAGFDWAEQIQHVGFGMMKQDGKKMSTRKGTVVLLEEVLEKSIALAKQYIAEKNPDLPDKDEVAEQVGVGAIIFHDLKNERTHDIDFSLQDTLRFEGETGPYVQYTHVRACSLLQQTPYVYVEGDVIITDDYAWQCVILISRFNEVVNRAGVHHDPSIVAKYVIDLAQSFNRYYANVKILDEDTTLSSRLMVVDRVRETLEEGLYLLGMAAPKQM